MEQQKKKKKKTYVASIACILIFAAILFLLQKYIAEPYRVTGDSMNPTLENKDVLFVDKQIYKKEEPKRFDMIVFQYQYDKKIDYIKRIIALPGETVEIKENHIFIDGVELKEYYGIYDGNQRDLKDYAAYQLKDDEYFVLGDNRDHSVDSRVGDVGPVKKSLILGKAVFRFWPFSSIGSLKYQ